MNCTDCVRGYTATYTLDSSNFKLIQLIVSQEKIRTTINRLGRKKVLEEISLDKCIKEIFNLDYDILLD